MTKQNKRRGDGDEKSNSARDSKVSKVGSNAKSEREPAVKKSAKTQAKASIIKADKPNTSTPTPKPSTVKSGSDGTRSSMRGRSVTLIALLIGLIAAAATYSINRVSTATPQAEAILILDESQVGWPFYRSTHELAREIIEGPSTFEAVAAATSAPELARGIELQPVSDLSLLVLTATAESEDAAIALVTASAEFLITTSAADRNAPKLLDLERLKADVADLELDLGTASSRLDSATSESERLKAASDVQSLAERVNSQRLLSSDLESEISQTSSAFDLVGEPSLRQPSRQSVLASIAAGAGAAVLGLLMLSIFTSPSGDQ